MKNIKLYTAVRVSNETKEEINNVILIDDWDNLLRTTTPNVKVEPISKDTYLEEFVVKKTVITSTTQIQLQRVYSVENPCKMKDASLNHKIKSNLSPHRREDTIEDDYSYIFNEDTVIKVDKLLPGASFTIYLYRANREILTELRDKAEVAFHSLDLFR